MSSRTEDRRERRERSRSRDRFRDDRQDRSRDRRPDRYEERGSRVEREEGERRSARRSRSPRRRSPSPRRSRSPSRRHRRSRSLSHSSSAERTRHKRKDRRRSRSRSVSSASSSSSSSSDERRHKRKHKHHKRKRSRSRSRDRKEKKKEKKDKKDKKKKKKSEHSVGAQWGKHGIISETDLYNKEAEFRSWLVEERVINPETISKEQTKKEFARFVEDYNTATLPHDKFYDIASYEMRMAALRAGEYLPPTDDGYDPNADMRALQSAHKRKPKESSESFMTREQLMELRKVQAERVEAGKMKLLGMDIKQNMGVRMDGTSFDDGPF
ncbi:hypothetical protein PsYK624_137690 [Phanerochaete sordida]|uniref:Uncharacterized protein n=1 Tax=Phanerochaete sordida TaxID=48140 RepID=A0A9P3GKG5_9APHY|nr:hypothetical protein PsYK624_137690 [Phanerochaete sordida]